MNSIPELCGYYIALLRTAYLIHQGSHWGTSGSNFYGNHLLFQRLYESAGKDADGAAEKMIGLFGDETLNLSMQAQFIGKMMAKYSGSTPLDNSLAVEKAILSVSDKLYKDLESEEKLTLGLDNFMQGVSDKREEAVYLLKQVMKNGSKTASRKDVLKKIADEKLKELKEKQKKKKEIEEAKSLSRLVHKKSQQEFGRIKEAPTVDPETDNASVIQYEEKWKEPGPARMPRPKPNYGLQIEKDMVTRIQVLLSMLYGPQILGPAGPDGKLGPATSMALKKYQAGKGLAQTGKLDAETLQHLQTENPGYNIGPTKQASQQGNPTQVIHQRLLTWLTATVVSYVPGQYNDGDITVDVDLPNRRIFGNIRMPKAIKPDLQTKIENDFRTQAKQLLGDVTGFTVGVGFAFFPKH